MYGTTGTSGTDRPEGPGQPQDRRARLRVRTAAVLGVLTLGVIGFAAFELAGRLGAHGGPAALPSSSAVRVTLQPAVTPATPAVSALSTSPVTQTARQPGPLTVVAATAFGPDGTADGDNPQIAARVLTDHAVGWMSQWYATPTFGDLKQGTGLLLDLGRSYPVTAVKVTLGSLAGAIFQVRLGQQAALGELPVAATGAASTARQVLALTPRAPVQARYVLLWFTQLPPDGAGHYQAWVRQVAVQGER